MRFDPAHLETLLVIAEEGTFDAAARRMHLTPSAVSQRVRALEGAAGQVLVRRSVPAAVTPAGEPLLRLARQLRLLADEADLALGQAPVVELPVAVNADSLATWFRPVLGAVAERGDIALRLHIEDQAYSDDLLRRGEVLAAVTAEPRPVQGCTVEPLGALRYWPAAASSLVARHRHGSRLDRSQLPMVVFNEKDHLQDEVLAARGEHRPAVVHRVPSTADFYEAIRCGLGWGLLPIAQLAPGESTGEITRLPGARRVDIPLFWQRWRLDSPGLAGLSEDVRRAAAAGLQPLRSGLRPGAPTPGPR